ncbi:hypothetical protein [Priestia endophytica]|uniref:hypothetical protein n=1 Tax=Priestia endophytica TaxID=135735 RepID=UPI001F5B17C4|nr:hypothetical protein [Priestia endophytica]
MTKLVLFANAIIFSLWLILQIALDVSVTRNPLNYFILILMFFLLIKHLKKKEGSEKGDVVKIALPAVIVIFILWILIQVALQGNIAQNPLNYTIVGTIFFLTIKYIKSRVK